jgi:hypothetical protein
MKHFAITVPTELSTKLFEFSEIVERDFIMEFRDALGCAETTTISGVNLSGFIPFQQGGFVVREYYNSSLDTWFTANQAKHNNDYYAECVKEWLVDNDHDSEYEYWNDDDFQEYESDIFEPSCLEFSMWVDGDKVVLELAINYLGGEFRRVDGEVIYEKNMTCDEFIASEFDVLLGEFTNYVNLPL